MTNSSCGYSDRTPKYDVYKLFHYTLHRHLPSILKDEKLKRKAALNGAGTLPAIWMTTNPLIEPTVWTRKREVNTFLPIRFKLKERILIYRMIDVISWSEYCQIGGYNNDLKFKKASKEYDEWLKESGERLMNVELREARNVGAEPTTEWYLCVKQDLDLCYFEPPQILYNGEWTGIEHLEQAISEESNCGVAVAPRFWYSFR